MQAVAFYTPTVNSSYEVYIYINGVLEGGAVNSTGSIPYAGYHTVALSRPVPLVAGHLYLALVHPATRHSLRGITLGTVRRDWAHRHHAKWDPDE